MYPPVCGHGSVAQDSGAFAIVRFRRGHLLGADQCDEWSNGLIFAVGHGFNPVSKSQENRKHAAGWKFSIQVAV
jgi:hypothetical protein